MVKPGKRGVDKGSKSKQYRAPGKRKEGNTSKYTTRNKALTRLQLKLPEFRRLCILKGIHPREPKKKFAGQNKTYYHVKDISFLTHEPLLEKSREIKAYEKKIKKARGRKNEELAQRFDRLRPRYALDHLVKERYPSFIDALRDMDDALTVLHLFATLPADDTYKIPAERVHSARRLKLEWQAYITRSYSLRKSFVSVKGIYYQANVVGQNVTWLTPHVLSQVLPNDVDFRVMLTFLEFYETLVGFINFKLYHLLGLRYPPILDPHLERAAAGLDELMEVVSEVVNEDGVNLEDEEAKKCRSLFKGLKFFLAREVPHESLIFVVRSFGGNISWDGDRASFEESDEDITHQIVDRPTQGHKFLSREYVQPQWVYDSANSRILLPTEAYVLGRPPPPHLSPFVDNEVEGYVPEYEKTIKSLQARHNVLPVVGVEDMDGASEIHNAAILRRSEGLETATRDQKAASSERLYAEELMKEVAGVPYSTSLDEGEQEDDLVQAIAGGRSPSVQPTAVKDENTEMAKIMMSRKSRKLHQAMLMGLEKKKAGVKLLKDRKKKFEEKSVSRLGGVRKPVA